MTYRRAKSLDKNLIFAEYFNSEQEVRRNGGVPTSGVEFNRGIATFGGSGSGDWIHFENIRSPLIGRYSIRIQFKIDESTTNDLLMDFRGSAAGTGCYVTVSNTVLSVSTAGVSKRYVNGVETNAFEIGEWTDFVISGWDINTQGFPYIAANYAAGGELACDVRLFEIYEGTLTAEEVSNLYNDARYVVPNLEHGIQVGSELHPDPTFSDPANLTLDRWTIADNKATLTAGGNSTLVCLGEPDSGSIGDLYQITITIDDWSAAHPTSGYLRLYLDANPAYVDVPVTVGVGTFSYNVRQTHNTESFDIRGVNITEAGSVVVSGISYKKATVEPTSKILHVTARDGVCRNLLSGGVNDKELVPDPTFQNESLWTTPTPASFIFTDGGIDINTSTADYIYDTSSLSGSPLNKTFQICFKVKNYQSGSIKGYLGATPSVYKTGNGVFVINSTVTNADPLVYVQAGPSGFVGTIEYMYIKEVIPEVTNTDIEVVKDGQIRVPRFNGSTSKIDCGDYNDLTGDITVLAWVKTVDNKVAYGIIGNGQMFVRYGVSTINYIITGSADTTDEYVPNLTEWRCGEYHLIAWARRKDGSSDGIYFDGKSMTIGGTPETPVAGTENITIGGGAVYIASSDNLNGNIAEVIVLEGLLTPEEISQFYTATKHLYGK